MLKKTLAVFVTAIVLGMSAMAVQAATFDFQSNRFPTGSFNMSSGGINLNVSGGSFDNAGNVTPGGAWVLSSASYGLGVSSWLLDNPAIDGKWGNDVAIFSFDQSVKFESVSFSLWDSNDEYTFFFGDPLASQGFDFASGYDLAAQNFMSDMFGIGAKDSNDNFKIRSISVSAVPLPSSVLLFGGALLGMGWLSRRKLKSAVTA